MHDPQHIRFLALGLVRDGDRLFLSRGYDATKNSYFYRALGGGVEFGERSSAALQREFQEELQAQITNIVYLACLENVFTFNDQPGHEVIQLYACDFADRSFYEREEITFNEGDRAKVALWVSANRCKSGELRVVPEVFLDYV